MRNRARGFGHDPIGPQLSGLGRMGRAGHKPPRRTTCRTFACVFKLGMAKEPSPFHKPAFIDIQQDQVYLGPIGQLVEPALLDRLAACGDHLESGKLCLTKLGQYTAASSRHHRRSMNICVACLTSPEGKGDRRMRTAGARVCFLENSQKTRASSGQQTRTRFAVCRCPLLRALALGAPDDILGRETWPRSCGPSFQGRNTVFHSPSRWCRALCGSPTWAQTWKRSKSRRIEISVQPTAIQQCSEAQLIGLLTGRQGGFGNLTRLQH